METGEVKLFYKQCVPEHSRHKAQRTDFDTLFLLHGAAFTSKTWQDSIPTIQTMCSLGYRVIAVDLPGTHYQLYQLNYIYIYIYIFFTQHILRIFIIMDTLFYRIRTNSRLQELHQIRVHERYVRQDIRTYCKGYSCISINVWFMVVTFP